MIHILRNKMADILTDAAHKGLAHIDPNSALGVELGKIDVEAVLKDDIEKICSHVSFFELTRILALAAQLKADEKKQGQMKAELKGIVQPLLERVESNSGKLKIPESLRTMIFNL